MSLFIFILIKDNKKGKENVFLIVNTKKYFKIKELYFHKKMFLKINTPSSISQDQVWGTSKTDFYFCKI